MLHGREERPSFRIDSPGTGKDKIYFHSTLVLSVLPAPVPCGSPDADICPRGSEVVFAKVLASQMFGLLASKGQFEDPS